MTQLQEKHKNTKRNETNGRLIKGEGRMVLDWLPASQLENQTNLEALSPFSEKKKKKKKKKKKNTQKTAISVAGTNIRNLSSFGRFRKINL